MIPPIEENSLQKFRKVLQKKKKKKKRSFDKIPLDGKKEKKHLNQLKTSINQSEEGKFRTKLIFIRNVTFTINENKKSNSLL